MAYPQAQPTKAPPAQTEPASAFGGGYPTLYASFFRYSLMREMAFKANFLFWLFVELLWFGLQLGFNSVVYLHTDSIGTWTKWEVVMLIGTSHFVQQLFQAFFLVNCSQLSNQVHTGSLDFTLLFPRNSRFMTSFRHVDIGGFIGAASGLAVVIYAAAQLGLSPSCWQILAYVGLCLVGITVHYSIMFVMATVSFWTVRANGLVMAYYNVCSVARLPDAVLNQSHRSLIALATPLLLVTNVPVKVLCAKLGSPVEIFLLLLLGCACFFVSHLVWKTGLRSYTSASS